MLFSLRIYFVQGYFIIAYGLGIYLLNNFIAFLTPLDLPGDGESTYQNQTKAGYKIRLQREL
jgi:hypothetical protein